VGASNKDAAVWTCGGRGLRSCMLGMFDLVEQLFAPPLPLFFISHNLLNAELFATFSFGGAG
jgi:hypothetical protein